jgi:hypothetical protein
MEYKMNSRETLVSPHFFKEPDFDTGPILFNSDNSFNKRIVEATDTKPAYVEILADGGWATIANLPYEEYADMNIEDIMQKFVPELDADDAIFFPDVTDGTDLDNWHQSVLAFHMGGFEARDIHLG